MSHQEQNPHLEKKSGFSWKEKLKNARKPVVAAIAVAAIGAASGAASLFGSNEKVSGTPVPEGKTATEAPIDPSPSTAESAQPVETILDTESITENALEFSTEAAQLIPDAARVVPEGMGPETEYQITYSNQDLDAPLEAMEPRSYIQGRIMPEKKQVILNAALETGEGTQKRLSLTAEMTDDNLFFNYGGDAPIMGATFREIFAKPGTLEVLEYTLLDKEAEFETVGVSFDEQGEPTLLRDNAGTEVPFSSPEAAGIAEQLTDEGQFEATKQAILDQLG